MNDIYGVFIIESLKLEDEQVDRRDGLILKDILDLCKIPCIYFYIRTAKELGEIINEFELSEYRYLHFSCHANATQIELTFEKLLFGDFADLIKHHLEERRVFISACEASNFEFAKTLIPSSKCFSLIGSPNTINFDKAAVLWSSFYHLMYESNKKSMKQPGIKKVLQELVDLHNTPINYYSFIRGNNGQLRENLIRPNQKIKTETKPVEDRV